MKINRNKSYSVIGLHSSKDEGFVVNNIIGYDSYISALNVVELLNKLDEDNFHYEVKENNYES